MVEIKKGYNFKIICLIISAVFLFTTTTYGLDWPKKTHLRPLLLTSSGQSRTGFEARACVANKINSGKVDLPVIDKSSPISAILLFLFEKLSVVYLPVCIPLAMITILAKNIFSYLSWTDGCMYLVYLPVSPVLIKFLIFQPIMSLPIKLTLTRFFRPDFYKQYYSKLPIERAEFILERLKSMAKERDDRELMQVLSVVKGFYIVDYWPAIGEVFDVPNGILDISAGMTEQPALLQYMIIRRARMMWYFGQPDYRNRRLYYFDLLVGASRFLVRHSKYIGMYLIYELSLMLVNSMHYRYSGKPLSSRGEAEGLGEGVLYTINEAKKDAIEEVRQGKRFTPEEFAEKYYFQVDFAGELLRKIEENFRAEHCSI